MKFTPSVTFLVIVYVDDKIIIDSSSQAITEHIQALNQFSLKELGDLNFFLGIQVQHTTSGTLTPTQTSIFMICYTDPTWLLLIQ